jgi:hypothetical protein
MSIGESVFRLADPSRVVRIAIDRSNDDLTITFHLLPLGASEPIEVRFIGAADVRFRGDRTELKEIVLLMVEDISSRGLEGANFLVKDYEEEFISFVCRKIDQAGHRVVSLPGTSV